MKHHDEIERNHGKNEVLKFFPSLQNRYFRGNPMCKKKIAQVFSKLRMVKFYIKAIQALHEALRAGNVNQN